VNEIRQHTYREQSVFARRPVLTGLAVGVATLAPHSFLSPEGSVGFAAVVIALIAGVYFGFAVMNARRVISSWNSTSRAFLRSRGFSAYFFGRL
jgi:hypothetical protein